MGVCGAVWFNFEHKSYLYRKIKRDVIWFGSICGYYFETIQFFFQH